MKVFASRCAWLIVWALAVCAVSEQARAGQTDRTTTDRTTTDQSTLEKATIEQAEALLRTGQAVRALELISPLARRRDASLEALIAFAWASLDSGDPESAREVMEQATKNSPDSAPAWFFLARAYGEEAKTANPLRGALLARKVPTTFERALALDAEFLEPRFGLIVFYMTAPSIVGGNREAAYEQARAVAKKDRYEGDRAWALVYELEGSLDRAEPYYRKMIERRPTDADPYLRLVWLTQRQKRFADAFEALDRMGEHHPDDRRRTWEIGRTAAFSGLRAEAGVVALEEILADRALSNERRALAHYHLATVYRHQGRDDRAIEELRQAVRLDPEQEAAATSLAELERFLGGSR